MAIEVLVSCMNQKSMSIIDEINLKTNAVIINQCGENAYTEGIRNHNKIKFISSDLEGLTKSRNLALANAVNDICIICDDDVVYYDNYEHTIEEAFNQIPDADVIIFNIDRINYDRNVYPIKKIRKAPRFKSYGSVRIAFKLQSLQQYNIWFDVNFGAGSKYSSGEESLLLKEIRKKNLKVYEYPGTIAKVDFSESTWRNGFNEKFFYDKGALLAATYPLLKIPFMFYFVKTLKSSTNLAVATILKWLIRGIRGYKQLLSYDDYIDKYN